VGLRLASRPRTATPSILAGVPGATALGPPVARLAGCRFPLERATSRNRQDWLPPLPIALPRSAFHRRRCAALIVPSADPRPFPLRGRPGKTLRSRSRRRKLPSEPESARWRSERRVRGGAFRRFPRVVLSRYSGRFLGLLFRPVHPLSRPLFGRGAGRGAFRGTLPLAAPAGGLSQAKGDGQDEQRKKKTMKTTTTKEAAGSVSGADLGASFPGRCPAAIDLRSRTWNPDWCAENGYVCYIVLCGTSLR